MARTPVTAEETEGVDVESRGRGRQQVTAQNAPKPAFGAQGTMGKHAGLEVASQRAAQRAAETDVRDEYVDADDPSAQLSGPLTGTHLADQVLSPNRPVQKDAMTLRPGGGNVGGGVRGMDITVEGEIGPKVPGDLIAAQYALAWNNATARALTLQARADALGIEFDITNELISNMEDGFMPALDEVEATLEEAENETAAIEELIDAARADQINPGQFFANIGGAGTFASALAVGAGAMASAFGGGPNVAADLIQKGIARNVRAQLANQRHNRALIAHQTQYAHTIRGLAKDQAAYANYLQIAYTAMAQQRVAAARTSYAEGAARIAAQNVYDQLQAQLVESQIKAITASRAKATFKVKSMAQLAQVKRMLGMQAQAQQPGAKPSLASRRKKKKFLPPEISDSTNAPSQVKKWASEIKTTLDLDRGEAARLKQQVLERMRPTDIGYTAVQQLGVDDLVADRNREAISISVSGEPKTFYVTDPSRMPKPNTPARSKAIKEISAARQMEEYAWDVHELLGIVSAASGPGALASALRVYAQNRIVGTPADPTVAQLMAELDAKGRWIEQYRQESKEGRNALSTFAETVRIAQEAGTDVNTFQQLADFITKNAPLRQARYFPKIELFQNEARAVEDKYGVRSAFYE